MSLVIRFSRTGKKGERRFLVIVNEKRTKRDTRPVDILGNYIKKSSKESSKSIDEKKLAYWISKGAQMSEAVKKIV